VQSHLTFQVLKSLKRIFDSNITKLHTFLEGILNCYSSERNVMKYSLNSFIHASSKLTSISSCIYLLTYELNRS